MSEEWPDDDARFTGPGCPLDKIGGVASGRAFKPEAPRPRRMEVKMKNVRELVGSLTQVRVQMLAAKAIIEEAANDCADEVECEALELDVRKLQRCMDIMGDVRERYMKPNEPPKES